MVVHYSPETYNKFQDDDGCPDSNDSINPTYTFPDTDGDGIEDRWDSCIDEPENYNDYSRSWDGCPDVPGAESIEDPDSDYDGIPDNEDNCPFDRENYNKFQDGDGCPDELQFGLNGDLDSDGILDDADACPLSPETYNKFQDDDGCPDYVADNKLLPDSDGDKINDYLDLCPTQA